MSTKYTELSEKVLFIGNGINNLTNKKSWENIISELKFKVGKKEDAEDLIKQFPMVFENLLNYGLINGSILKENELKEIVAEKVSQITPNEIHKRINDLCPAHIITTNYDFVLETDYKISNQSRIIEKRFSVFRKYKETVTGRSFWHVHGDCFNPASINLGFEHYCGQLQDLRNFVVSGTNYKTKNYNNEPLTKRLSNLSGESDSWVELIFKKEIHIIGLCLDFVEIDLWWLLTWRSKLINSKRFDINNYIFFYIPRKYYDSSKGKLELLANLHVNVKVLDLDGMNFYNAIFNGIKP